MVDPSGRPILDSWKEISHYLNREIRTCQRWQKDLGLPVYRIDDKSPRSKVFAYKSEIDQWLKDKTTLQPLPGNGNHKKPPLVLVGISVGVLLLVAGTVKMIPVLSPNRGTSIALLPLKNANPSGDDNYLSEELARVIADSLPVAKKLRVIPAFAVRGLLGPSSDLHELSRRLGADYVLRGTVEKGNPDITVAAELVRPGDGAVIWKGQFQESFGNAFAIPDGICSGVRKTLKIKSAGIPRKDMNAKDYQAIDSYLKGDFILSRLSQGSNDSWRFYHQGEFYAGRGTLEANEIAIKMFSQAAALEPDFAMAYIGLASCYANYVNFNWRTNVEWLNKAEALLRKAQALTPDLAEYYGALIQVKFLREATSSANVWDEIPALVAEGIKRHPEHPRMNAIAGYYHYAKFARAGDEADFRKALEFMEKSFWLRPYHLNNIIYATFLMLNGEFDKALDVCRLLEKLDSTFMIRYLIGEISYYRGDLAAGKAIFKALLDSDLDFRIGALYYLAAIYAREGEGGKARSALKEVQAISPEKFMYYAKDFRLASVWAGLGEKDLALKALKDFLGNPRFRRQRYVYGKFMALDENLRALRSERTIQEFFGLTGERESDGKK